MSICFHWYTSYISRDATAQWLRNSIINILEYLLNQADSDSIIMGNILKYLVCSVY